MRGVGRRELRVCIGCVLQPWYRRTRSYRAATSAILPSSIQLSGVAPPNKPLSRRTTDGIRLGWNIRVRRRRASSCSRTVPLDLSATGVWPNAHRPTVVGETPSMRAPSEYRRSSVPSTRTSAPWQSSARRELRDETAGRDGVPDGVMVIVWHMCVLAQDVGGSNPWCCDAANRAT